MSHSLSGDTSVSVEREMFALDSSFYETMTRSRPFEGVDDCTIES